MKTQLKQLHWVRRSQGDHSRSLVKSLIILAQISFLLGWQTRWFVLEDDILSYYMSQEEVNQGCKGSIKVSALEIMGKSVCNCSMYST